MNVDQPIPFQHALERDFVIVVGRAAPGQLCKHHDNDNIDALTDFARQFGWSEKKVVVLDARKEPCGGTGDDLIRSALRRVKEGNVGAIAIGGSNGFVHSTLGSDELWEAAAQGKCLIVVEGRIYNPAATPDKLILRLLSSFAEFDNEARTRWMRAVSHGAKGSESGGDQ
jgi:hypothetical protein